MSAYVVVISILDGVAAIVMTPFAASNIYHQQYQMHRLVTQFWQQPVAVNDLGWVSYQNDQYVLDLWGLASGEARRLRKGNPKTETAWMETLAARHDIALVMVYHNDTWFPEVPPTWQEVATLDVRGSRVTAWFPVSLYVRDSRRKAEVIAVLERFRETLPAGSRMEFR